jgi:hypothetical protein
MEAEQSSETVKSSQNQSYYSDLDLDEVERRMPMVESINHEDLRFLTKKVIAEHTPKYFWDVPASSSGNYHTDDHVKKHGLWLHTLRAFLAFEGMTESLQQSEKLSAWSVDCGRAAILLHDLYKQGVPPRNEKHTIDDHDIVAYKQLKQKTDLPDKVLGCILSHNGPWSQGREPQTPLENTHHLADMMGSRSWSTFSLENCEYDIPEELMDQTLI